ELSDVSNGVVLKMREELGSVGPLGRRHRDPFHARAVDEEEIAGEDEAEPKPDRPPILLAPELAPAGARRPGRRAHIGPAHRDSLAPVSPRGAPAATPV